MDYNETLRYLQERLPMFQRIGPRAFKKDLKNTLALCAALGQPQEQFASIHVAGTNGKGSVSALIASALTAAGYKTGLYTSPHLIDFTERIRIDGREIGRDEVVAFVEAHQSLIEEVNPSFFELTVAMAFEHFARQEVDIAVIEVGMGGRLDSTNVIQPEVGVITNISMDHAQFLGDSLSLIAGEKAGIIKHGLPVVVGQTHPETEPVFRQRAKTSEADIHFADQLYELDRLGRDLQGQRFEVIRANKLRFGELQVGLPGLCQAENTATALEALHFLNAGGKFRVSDEAIQEGFSQVRELSGIRGRMEVLGYQPLVLADVAHNEAGVQEVVRFLKYVPRRELRIVWGSVADKDLEPILALLPQEAHYYFVRPDVPRGLDEEILAEAAVKAGLLGTAHPSVAIGMAAALQEAHHEDLVFVGGSTFVVAEVLS